MKGILTGLAIFFVVIWLIVPDKATKLAGALVDMVSSRAEKVSKSSGPLEPPAGWPRLYDDQPRQTVALAA